MSPGQQTNTPSFYDRFNSWCKTTSCHGFPQFTESQSKTAKVFWGILIVGLSIQLIITASSTIANFCDPNKRWGTRVEEVRVAGRTFHPTITVCNHNRYRKSVVRQLNVTHDILSYGISLNPAIHYLYKNPISNETRKKYLDWTKSSNLTNYDIMKLAGHKCEGMVKILKMTYNGWDQKTIANPCNTTMEANHMELKPINAFDLDTMCTTLRVDVTKNEWTMDTLGQGKGTTLLLDVQPEEYLDEISNNPPDVGFAIQLTYGDHIDYGRWVNVPPGYHAWISMSVKWNKPGQALDGLLFGPPCNPNPRMRFLDNKYYCKEMCYYDCAQIPVVKYCGCHFQKTKHLPACSIDVSETCAMPAYGKPLPQDWYEVQQCYETCGDPCEYITIYPTVSFTRFPAPQQLRSYQRSMPEIFGNMSLEEIRSRYALIDVYYGSGAILITEWRLLHSLSLLSSNLGGQMGLYLGISIITMVHAVIYFCLEPMKNVFMKKQINDSTRVQKL